ncbi:MAG: glycosyltransferase family 39 protein [Gemmatimonadota bacterium]
MDRRTLTLFFAAVVLLYLSSLGTMPLLEPDEARYAEIPREMIASGDYVTPRLNGVAYLEKPPLFYWGNALSIRLFGETEFAARFFTAAVSAAGILLTYWMGATLCGWRTGLYAAIVLSTSLYYYVIGRLNTLDMTAAVTLLLAIFPAYLYLSARRTSRVYLYLSYAGAGLAFLAKGLIGAVFPAAVISVWLVFSRRHREIGRAVSLGGIVLFLAITLPWIVLVQRDNPDFLWFFFVHEQFLRYTTKIHGRYEPFWYFLPVVLVGFIPWIAFLQRIVVAVRRSAQEFLPADATAFLLSWILFVFLFFSFSKSKLVTYMTPLFPPLAVLLGRGLEIWASREDGSARCRAPLALAAVLAAAMVFLPDAGRHHLEMREWIGVTALPATLILSWGAVPLFVRRLGAERVVLLSFLLLALFLTSVNRPAAIYLGNYKSSKNLSLALAASLRPGDVIVQYRTYKQGVPWYTGRRTVLVDEVGELGFGAERAKDRARYFIGEAEFERLWKSRERVFAVFGRDAMPLIRERFPDARLLYRTDEGILIVNRS